MLLPLGDRLCSRPRPTGPSLSLGASLQEICRATAGVSPGPQEAQRSRVTWPSSQPGRHGARALDAAGPLRPPTRWGRRRARKPQGPSPHGKGPGRGQAVLGRGWGEPGLRPQGARPGPRASCQVPGQFAVRLLIPVLLGSPRLRFERVPEPLSPSPPPLPQRLEPRGHQDTGRSHFPRLPSDPFPAPQPEGAPGDGGSAQQAAAGLRAVHCPSSAPSPLPLPPLLPCLLPTSGPLHVLFLLPKPPSPALHSPGSFSCPQPPTSSDHRGHPAPFLTRHHVLSPGTFLSNPVPFFPSQVHFPTSPPPGYLSLTAAHRAWHTAGA